MRTLSGSRRVGAEGDPQCRRLGQILERPDDRAVRDGDLADKTLPGGGETRWLDAGKHARFGAERARPVALIPTQRQGTRRRRNGAFTSSRQAGPEADAGLSVAART